MLRTYQTTYLDFCIDVSDTFNKMIIDRFKDGKKGLRYTRLYTHQNKMSVNKKEVPFIIQCDDNIDILIYLN